MRARSLASGTLRRLISLSAVILLVATAPSNALRAGENYAFLVAVGEYDAKQLHKLPYSRNDILEFNEVLLASGFKKENITLMHDDPAGTIPARLFPEAAKIRKQLTLILSGRDEDDTIILAFAGHGVQFKGDPSSYFCPLDVVLENKETLIPLKEVYDAMKACPAKKKLLLVDACRNDPRTTVSRSRKTVDLESVTRPQKQAVPESVMAFFSCSAGQQSFEWPELQHGVFFYHILDVWKKGVDSDKELTLDDLVYQTRKKTEAFARNTLEAVQTPELHGASSGRWVLRTYDKSAPDAPTTKPMPMKTAGTTTSKPVSSSPVPNNPSGNTPAPKNAPPTNTAVRPVDQGEGTYLSLDIAKVRAGDLPKTWKGQGLVGVDLSQGYPALALTATPTAGSAVQNTLKSPPVELSGDYFVEFELVPHNRDSFDVKLIEENGRLGPTLKMVFGQSLAVALGDNRKLVDYSFKDAYWCRIERRETDLRFSINGDDRSAIVLRGDEAPTLFGIELEFGDLQSSILLRSLKMGPLTLTEAVGETKPVIPNVRALKRGELPKGWTPVGVVGPNGQQQVISDPMEIVGDFYVDMDVIYKTHTVIELTLLGKDDWPSLPIKVATASQMTMRVGTVDAHFPYEYSKPIRLRLERQDGTFRMTADGSQTKAVALPADGYGPFRGIRINLGSPAANYLLSPLSVGPLKAAAPKK
jgi:uncharacterized caspase-like protein